MHICAYALILILDNHFKVCNDYKQSYTDGSQKKLGYSRIRLTQANCTCDPKPRYLMT